MYGVWTILTDGRLAFNQLVKSPSNLGKYIIKTSDGFTVRPKDIISSINGDILFGILPNGSLVQHGGLTNLRPFGSPNVWMVHPIQGSKLHQHIYEIIIEMIGGELVEKKGMFLKMYKFQKTQLFSENSITRLHLIKHS